MLRIVAHIEQLLLMHDCIIIPGFGGFVLQSIPATYVSGEHLFSPLRKEIVFNRTLQHNDGLLTESYRQRYQADYPTAQTMVEDDVQAMQTLLAEEKQLSLGALGTITLGEEGQFIFQPATVHTFSLDSYGLSPFRFATLESLEATVREEALLLAGKKKKKDTLYVPVNLNFVRGAVAAAAAIALFLLVSTPVKEIHPSAYTASFIPSEMVAYPTPSSVSSGTYTALTFDGKQSSASSTENNETILSPAQTPAPAKPSETAFLTPKAGASASGKTASGAEERATTPPAKTASSGKAQVSTPATATPAATPRPKMYHIVIASFPTQAQADTYMASVDRKECKHLSRVVRDGKYRIYADKFDNRKDAEEYMATLRKNKKYKDAWLFISR